MVGGDRYRGLLGVVPLGQTNINLWLVESGLVWAYKGAPERAPPTLTQ